MDKKKRLRRDRLQNFLIAVLSISAVYLFLLTASLEMELPSFSLSSAPVEETVGSASHLQELDWPATLVIHDGSKTRLYRQLSTSDSEFTSVEGLWEALFREEFTSLSISFEEFQSALSLPGIYVSFPDPIPQSILSARLGLPSAENRGMQRLLLAADGADVLFYYCDGEHYYFSYTELSAAELFATADIIGGSNCSFAFEQEDSALHPLTVLPAELPPYPALSVSAVSAVSNELLGFFGFNAHTTNRYTDSTGTEVIVESPRRLSITPDGRIRYLGNTSYAPEGFSFSEQSSPPLSELVDGAYRLLTQLYADTDLRFYLSDAEYSADGGTCTLRFSRMINGLPLLSGDGEAAAEFVIKDGTVVNCSFLRREYAISDTPALLLPLRQASAIAAQYEGMEMGLSYVDNGGDSSSVSWLMR